MFLDDAVPRPLMLLRELLHGYRRRRRLTREVQPLNGALAAESEIVADAGPLGGPGDGGVGVGDVEGGAVGAGVAVEEGGVDLEAGEEVLEGVGVFVGPALGGAGEGHGGPLAVHLAVEAQVEGDPQRGVHRVRARHRAHDDVRPHFGKGPGRGRRRGHGAHQVDLGVVEDGVGVGFGDPRQVFFQRW